ncbi:MAG: lysoplasmalogenase [Desulfobacterales bacterium]
MTLPIITLAVILSCALLIFEKKESLSGRLLTKTPLSALFVIAALVQPHPSPSFYHFMLIGLICCMAGDICLIFPRKNMFFLGLVAFLLGHIWYIIGFFDTAQLHLFTWLGALMVLLTSGPIFFWLRPHLGSMKLPVLFYVIFISLMVCGAWTVLGDAGLARSGRILVFCGALLFYFSDLFVARQRFIKKAYLNRLFGLPLYYTGQFLLAFSIGILK